MCGVRAANNFYRLTKGKGRLCYSLSCNHNLKIVFKGTGYDVWLNDLNVSTRISGAVILNNFHFITVPG